jgi:hypothetical protein
MTLKYSDKAPENRCKSNSLDENSVVFCCGEDMIV